MRFISDSKAETLSISSPPSTGSHSTDRPTSSVLRSTKYPYALTVFTVVVAESGLKRRIFSAIPFNVTSPMTCTIGPSSNSTVSPRPKGEVILMLDYLQHAELSAGQPVNANINGCPPLMRPPEFFRQRVIQLNALARTGKRTTDEAQTDCPQQDERYRRASLCPPQFTSP